MTEVLPIGGLEFEIRRSVRRKTWSLTVDRGGELVAHVPAGTTREELSRWIEKKLLWVHQKLLLKEEIAPKVRPPEYVTGEGFCYLGRRYRLKVVREQAMPLRFDGTRFFLRSGAEPAEPHFRQWYRHAGQRWLEKRVKMLTLRIGAEPDRIQVRDLGYRWASCGKDRALNFNWKLLQLPVRLIDYVLAHELLHLRLPHHKPEFWKTLSEVMPGWEERKDALASRAKEYLVFGLAP